MLKEVASCRANEKLRRPRASAANTDLAEAQDHTAPGGGTAKAHLWAETREKQHLVKFALHACVQLTGNHAIAERLTIGIYHGFDEKRMLSTRARDLLELDASMQRSEEHTSELQ